MKFCRTAPRQWHVLQSAVAAIALSLGLASPLAAQDGPAPPEVPGNLEVPAGNSPYLTAHAAGTQTYICLTTGSKAEWTFLGPQATLFDGASEQVLTHFLSPNPVENGALRPTWQHSGDTSAVWAARVDGSTDPNFVAPGAIPWLLLRVVGAEAGPTGGNALTATTFIHRVNTSGGSAPSTGCKVAKDLNTVVFVPYTTDYVFYRPGAGN